LKNSGTAISIEKYLSNFAIRGKLNLFLNEELLIVRVLDAHFLEGSSFLPGSHIDFLNSQSKKRLLKQLQIEELTNQLTFEDKKFDSVLIFTPFGKYLRLVPTVVQDPKSVEKKLDFFQVEHIEESSEHEVGYVVVDRDMNCLHTNSVYDKLMLEFTGQESKENRSLLEILSSSNKSQFMETIHRVFQGESFIQEHEFEDRDGKLRFFHISFAPFFERGEIVGVNVITSEVTRIVAERKKSWDLLNFLKSLVHEAPMEVVVLDRDFKYVFIGRNAIVDPELRKWLVGKSDYEYCERLGIDKTLASRRLERFHQLKEEMKPISWIENYTSKSGEAKSMFRTFSPILQADGSFGFALGFSFDNTEKQRIERDYQEVREQFNALFEQAPEALLLMDFDKQKYIAANTEAVNLFGYTKDELLNMKLGGLSPSDAEDLDITLEDVRQKIASSINGNPTTFEWEILTKSGSRVPVEVRVNRLPSHNGILLRSIITDISYRKEAENKLKASEHRYKSLIENSVQGILVVDTRKQILAQANSQAASILGKDIVGQKLDVIVNPELIQGTGITTRRTLEVFFRDVLVHAHAILEVQIQNNKGDIYDLVGVGYRLYQDNVEMVAVVFDDKTEETRQRRELMNQKQLFQTFFDTSPTPVAMLDKHMNYVLVGKEWFTQYPTEYGNDIIGRNHYDLHPEVPLRWKIAYQKTLNGQITKNTKDYLDTPYGRQWYKWECRPWYESNGNVGGIILYSEIISDEIRLQEERVEQEKRFKRLFENSSIGWMEIDYSNFTKDEVLESGNKSNEELEEFLKGVKILNANEEILNVIEEDLSGKPLLDFFNKIYGDYWHEFYRQELRYWAAGSEEFNDELEIQTNSGKKKVIYLSTRLPAQDRFSSIIYGVLDITDLKTSTTALRESEARYRTIFESSNLGIIYYNKRTGLVKTNPAFKRIVGYSGEDIYPGFENNILLEEYHKESDENYLNLQNGNAKQFVMEKQYIRKDGKVITARTASSGLFDTKQVHYGNVTIIEDITDLRVKENQIKAQNEELIKINNELDQFVYSAAHDLRAPVANVMGLIQLLKLEKLSGDAEKYLLLQEQSLDKLDEFIRGIINYSRNARQDLVLEEIDVKNMIYEIIDSHAYLPKAQGMHFEVKCPEELIINSDVQRLSIVLNNLVSNAIRYSDSNKEERLVKIEVEKMKSKIRVSIWDNGVGIPDDEKEKIFDNFYRAHARSEGTGIGLYLVKETLKKLKGVITVDSEENKWTRFNVDLENRRPQ
jgi:PAS domain S-box-containing protein